MTKETKLIYEKLKEQINKVISAIETENNNNMEDITSTIENLKTLNEAIQLELSELGRLSEWERFTIAFYGETNAGKSTLIEALRILLNESTKLESQKQFKTLAEESGLTQEAFDKVRQTIMTCNDAIEKTRQDLQQLNQKYVESITLGKIEIDRLDKLLQQIKNSQNLWERIYSFFSPPKEKSQLMSAKQSLEKIKSAHNKDELALKKHIQTLEKEKQQAEKENKRLSQASENLAQFADGQIIGDGRSDFTRENTSFDFNYNNQAFSLIDVPGIEGNEEIVSNPIQEAVKKAHAVFYVTRTPRPPQTNDGEEQNREGTLEKIKKHLGAQTEVWTIYNHAVNNPRQLKEPLVDKGELAGLQALDEKLKKELGDNYCQSLIVSARPAYLGLTECIIPGSKDANDQKKLFDRFGSKDEILKLSWVANFVEKLSSTIVGDYREKIKRSNLNKVSKAIDKSTDILSSEIKNLSHKKSESKKQIVETKKQINVLLEQFLSSLNSEGGKILNKFEKEIREKVYSYIEDDISNDRFKSILSDTLSDKADNVEEQLKSMIKKEAKSFESEVTDIVKRGYKHLSNIANENLSSFQLDEFNININIDNGISVLGLLSSGVGVVTGTVLLASNPVGWTLAFVGGAAALVSALVSFYKSIRSFFSSDYKKSQQKSETDKVIRNAKSNIREKMDQILNEIDKAMRTQVQPVLNSIEAPLEQYQSVIQILQQSKNKLSNISNSIHN